MCTAMELNEITRSLAKEYRSLFGKDLKQVILYGSYARGDYDSESDVDIAAIVNQPREALSGSYRRLAEVASELSLTYGLTVSPAVIPYNDYTKYATALPYYRNIRTEGVEICV